MVRKAMVKKSEQRDWLLAAMAVIFLCISIAAGIIRAEEVWAGSGSSPGGHPRLTDEAGLLTEQEKSGLLARLDEVSERQKLDIVIVTANSLDGAAPMEYADDFYDKNGYGYGPAKDGVLLLISMEDRDWWISTCGYGITAFTDGGIEYLSEQFMEDLSGGRYEAAFHTYISQCDDFITQAKSGRPYDRSNLPHEPLSPLWILAALGIGLVSALAAVAVMRSKLKTVRAQGTAGSYVREGSMHLTDSREFFLYRNVHRTPRPKQTSSGSSTHTSSSGTTHGGGGGKF